MNAVPDTSSQLPVPNPSTISHESNANSYSPSVVGENRDQAELSATSSGSTAKRPESGDPKDPWNGIAEPSRPQWPTGNSASLSDPVPSGSGTWSSGAIDSQPAQAPRIAATGILPASARTERAPGQRPPDALDEFEAEIQKNEGNFNPGRSSSNAGGAAKPSVRWLPREQQIPANKSGAVRDSSATAADPWSVRIEPRRNPPPMFAPDDFSLTDKKPSSKQESFDAGTNWSDLPAWQGAPAPGNSSADRDAGPAIRPGSF
jgi:hypothetical protein